MPLQSKVTKIPNTSPRPNPPFIGRFIYQNLEGERGEKQDSVLLLITNLPDRHGSYKNPICVAKIGNSDDRIGEVWESVKAENVIFDPSLSVTLSNS
jgi:hypothetical protein